MVVSELRGEKIDIIPFNDEPARFVAKALSPARVREVLVDDDAKQATVIVPDDQLSLAIGREGQNARLAARLTGWRVDIRSESEFAAEEAEHGYEEEEVQGRCAAILSNGRRCPNAALPGSRYCGIETHQALTALDSDRIADLAPPGNGSPPAGSEPRQAELAEAASEPAETGAVAAEAARDEVAAKAAHDEVTATHAARAGPRPSEAEQASPGQARTPPAMRRLRSSGAPGRAHPARGGGFVGGSRERGSQAGAPRPGQEAARTGGVRVPRGRRRAAQELSRAGAQAWGAGAALRCATLTGTRELVESISE